MKKKLISLLLLPMIALSQAGDWEMDFDEDWAAASSAWTPASLSPVAWYKGDSTATDSSGSGYDAEWSGTEAYTNGVNALAVSYNGASSLTITTNIAAISGGSFSLAMWIKPTNDFNDLGSGINYEQSFVCVKATPTIANLFQWKIDTDSDRIQFAVFNASQNLIVNVFGENITWEANKWYHIAVVFNGSGYSFYLDGLLDGYTSDLDSLPATTKKINIGGLPDYPAHQYFNGLMDDVLFFDRALTTNEITQIYEWRE